MYKPGKKHGDADGLSRDTIGLDDLQKSCTEEISLQKLSAVLSVSQNSVAHKCGSHVNVSMLELNSPPPNVKCMDKDQLKQSQIADPVIGPVYRMVCEGRKPMKVERNNLAQASKVLLKQLPKLKLG